MVPGQGVEFADNQEDHHHTTEGSCDNLIHFHLSTYLKQWRLELASQVPF